MKVVFTLPEIVTLVELAKPIPLVTVVTVTTDWATVWETVQRDGQFVLNCSYKESRLFYSWVHHHKQGKISIVEVVQGVWLARMKQPK